MDNEKNNGYYLSKVIGDLNFIVKHTKGLSYDEIAFNEILVDSIMFRLIQISENSNKLTEDFKEFYSFVPWRALRGMRNRIVHEYGNVNLSVVYDTVSKDIPSLLEALRQHFSE